MMAPRSFSARMGAVFNTRLLMVFDLRRRRTTVKRTERLIDSQTRRSHSTIRVTTRGPH